MRLNHPTIPGASKNVPDEMAEKWLDNGWTPAEEKEPEPTKKAAAKRPVKK